MRGEELERKAGEDLEEGRPKGRGWKGNTVHGQIWPKPNADWHMQREVGMG